MGANAHRPMLIAVPAALSVCLISPLLLTLRAHLLLLIPVGLLLLIPALRRRPTVPFLLAVTAVFLIRCGLYQHLVYLPARQACLTTETLTMKVIDTQGGGKFCTVRVTEDGTRVRRGMQLRLYHGDRLVPERHEVLYGEVKLSLPDPPMAYAADDVFAVAMPTVFGEDGLQTLSTGDVPALQQMRGRLLSLLRQRMPGEEGAVLGAMLLGEKQSIPDELDGAFRSSGLPHLLVVSGLHLTLVVGAVFAALRLCRLREQLRVVLTMIVTLLYMQLVGLTPSVMRAGTMCLIMLTGRLFRRRADGLNSLGAALLLLLLICPHAWRDIGLQLSFGATFGVLAIAPGIDAAWSKAEGRGRVPRFVLGGLAVTLGASLPILPLTALYFRQISWTSPVANVLASLPSTGLLITGMAGIVLLPVPVLNTLGTGLLWVSGVLCRILCGIARLLGGSSATLPVRSNWMVLWLTAACAVLSWLLAHRHRRAAVRTLIVAVALCVAVGGVRTLRLHDRVRACAVPADSGAALLIGQNGRYAAVARDADGLNALRRALTAAGDPTVEVLIAGGGTQDAATVLAFIADYAPQAVYAAEGAQWTFGLRDAPDAGELTAQVAIPGGTLRCTADGRLIAAIGAAQCTLLPEGLPSGEIPPDECGGLAVFSDTTAVQDGWRAYAFAVCANSGTAQHAPSAQPDIRSDNEACWLTAGRDGKWSKSDDIG